MERIRAFVAIELTEEVAAALGRVRRRLKEQVALAVRWLDPKNTHLTLMFLGDVDSERVDGVKQAIERATAGVGPFSISLGRVGGFPNLSRPRVLWVGVEGDLPALRGLQDRVEREMTALGFPKEERGFQPHLTLGRVREEGRRAPPLDAPAIERAVASVGAGQTVEGLTLFRSDLRPSGPVYTALGTFPLR